MTNKTTVIAIYGSSGAGKSFLTYALGNLLARNGKKVICVSPDVISPAMTVWLPEQKVPCTIQNSLGELLQTDEYSTEAIARHILTHPNNRYLGFMGYVAGETPFSYSPADDSQIVEFMVALSEFADFILVDCSTNPISDALSLFAMQKARHRIRVLTPDYKGILYEKAIRPLISDKAYGYSSHIMIFNQVHEESPIKELRKCLDAVCEYILPYSVEAQIKYLNGELITGCKKRRGSLLEDELNALAEAIYGDHAIMNGDKTAEYTEEEKVSDGDSSAE